MNSVTCATSWHAISDAETTCKISMKSKKTGHWPITELSFKSTYTFVVDCLGVKEHELALDSQENLMADSGNGTILCMSDLLRIPCCIFMTYDHGVTWHSTALSTAVAHFGKNLNQKSKISKLLWNIFWQIPEDFSLTIFLTFTTIFVDSYF